MSSSLGPVRQSDVDDAKEQANRLGKEREEYNRHPRRDKITKEEDKLKYIATTVEVSRSTSVSFVFCPESDLFIVQMCVATTRTDLISFFLID